MRNIAAVFVLLLFVGCYMIVMDGGPSSDTVDGPVWRRTVDGWQLLDLSPPIETNWAVHVHPSLVAAMIALLSCGALLLSEISRDQARTTSRASLKDSGPTTAYSLSTQVAVSRGAA